MLSLCNIVPNSTYRIDCATTITYETWNGLLVVANDQGINCPATKTWWSGLRFVLHQNCPVTVTNLIWTGNDGQFCFWRSSNDASADNNNGQFYVPSSFYPSRKRFLESAGYNTWPNYDNWEVFSYRTKQHLPHSLGEHIDVGPAKIVGPLIEKLVG